MRLLICDDNQEFLQIFKREIENNLARTNTKAVIEVVSENIKDIRTDYDIYFLDVEMPEITGFELSKNIKECNKNAIVIFITGKGANYVYDSFKYAPFDFIRKEYYKEELMYKWHRIIDNYNSIHSYYHYNYAGLNVKVPLDEILIIERHGNFLEITTTKVTYKERKSIEKILLELDDNFYQVNRSTIINFKHVKSAEKESFVLTNQIVVYYRKRHKQKALNMFYDYLNKR